MRHELEQLVSGIEDFNEWNHANKIRLFAWFFHAVRKLDRFSGAEILQCYSLLNLEKPEGGVSPWLSSMERRQPKEALRDSKGWYLERRVRERMDSQYGTRDITLNLEKSLMDLPARVPSAAERDFLNEALICLRYNAARSAIIMTWNLAFSHLLEYVLAHHLAAFNAEYASRFAKKHAKAKVRTIVTYDDFAVDLKESEVLEICKGAGIITKEIFKILDEKLDKRNTAAHPSNVRVTQVQAEAFIDDIITNALLQLKL